MTDLVIRQYAKPFNAPQSEVQLACFIAFLCWRIMQRWSSLKLEVSQPMMLAFAISIRARLSEQNPVSSRLYALLPEGPTSYASKPSHVPIEIFSSLLR